MLRLTLLLECLKTHLTLCLQGHQWVNWKSRRTSLFLPHVQIPDGLGREEFSIHASVFVSASTLSRLTVPMVVCLPIKTPWGVGVPSLFDGERVSQPGTCLGHSKLRPALLEPSSIYKTPKRRVYQPWENSRRAVFILGLQGEGQLSRVTSVVSYSQGHKSLNPGSRRRTGSCGLCWAGGVLMCGSSVSIKGPGWQRCQFYPRFQLRKV